MYRPCELIAGLWLLKLPWVSVLDTLTRRVVPSFRSRTNTSAEKLVSPGTRFVASELKETYRPCELIAGLWLLALPWVRCWTR